MRSSWGNPKVSVDIYICAYTEVPLQGRDGNLEFEYLPMWALLRTGNMRLNSTRGNEYFLGLGHTDGLEPTISGKVDSILEDPKSSFAKILVEQSGELSSVIMSKFGTPEFVSIHKSYTRHEEEKLIGVVLLTLEQAKMTSFTIENGFGVFVYWNTVKKIDEEDKAERKRVKELFESGKPATIKSFFSSFKIDEKFQLIINLGRIYGHTEIESCISSMKSWNESFRQKRLAQWKKAGERIIG